MMKKLILPALLMTILGATEVQANTTKAGTFALCSTQGKVAVRPDDLPEAVKNTLSGDAYAGWQVTSAFLVTKEDNSQYFEVNAKKGEESTVINLDKYGKKVD
ncbi:hypothetical protein MUK70_26755 [Dyadobacter chenwenxiniae]|uniref:Uncharacterized protein n=1 Tax=Dyadobacter chenwenxiniae TaxID=2906456 RepID=A0A9X1TGQ0_9BACT|nr:hypothetical protein [Dyadobacter chenwenxiniae]MCF0063880.1 hypothetical protein [Dyadobacter chenwenxiniae]UON82612.1 hypothetical protein MUK70_26755 [Dyadobacter chenwenxiniae]